MHHVPQQAQAIEAEGNVLVMAAAGTGKTSTLVGRVMNRICQSASRLSIDQILMVTFTEAAAAEMRRRLSEALHEELLRQPGNRHLQEQVARLDRAVIGTLHSFCLRLIRDHFNELGLDPDLSVLDEIAAARLAREALDEVLQPQLDGNDPRSLATQELADSLFAGNLEALRTRVLRTHDYARSLPAAGTWLENQAASWRQPNADAWTLLRQSAISEWTRHWMARLEPLKSSTSHASECQALLSQIRTLSGDFTHVLLDQLVVLDGNGRGKKRKTPKPFAQLFEDARFLRSLFPRSPDQPHPIAEDWGWCSTRMLAFIELVRDFGRQFARRKREISRVDFADLEQFALELLAASEQKPISSNAAGAQMELQFSTVTRTPCESESSVAADCRRRFALILVDECQDLNAAQNAILERLSRHGSQANRFLVGDVKQSIYRFRLADPHIFQKYALQWRSSGSEGQVIPLTDNFRSAASILTFVNALFPLLMHRDIGGVEYDASAELKFGNPAERFPLAEPLPPRVHVFVQVSTKKETDDASVDSGDNGAEGSEEEVSAEQLEAHWVAQQLQTLHANRTPIWDREMRAFRPVEWRDMIVLLRSPKSLLTIFADEFRMRGIPFEASPGDLFDEPEILDLTNLLRILDNPLQDIPLAAVLRSAFAGIANVNELAVVRLGKRSEFLWQALNHFWRNAPVHIKESATGEPSGDPNWEALTHDAEESVPLCSSNNAVGDKQSSSSERLPDEHPVFLDPVTAAWSQKAWPKVDQFLRRFERWRRMAERSSLGVLVELLLDETGYEEWVRTRPNAAQGLANIRSFVELVRQFEAQPRAGLHRFLNYLQACHDYGLAARGSTSADVVRASSIHQSKGLEFPIVALAGLGYQFNFDDLNDEIIRDETLGLCPVVVAPNGSRYPSLPFWLARQRQRREFIGEELRLLYVACTRAADHLLLFGSAQANDVARWTESAGLLPDVTQTASARKALDWLGPALGQLARKADWATTPSGTCDLFNWSLEVPPRSSEPESEIRHRSEAQSAAVAEPSSNTFEYSYLAETREAAKQSVTSLRRRLGPAGDPDASEDWIAFRKSVTRSASEGMPSTDVAGADRGSIHHRFLEKMSLDEAISKASLGAQLERLKAEGQMSSLDASALNLDALARFWESDLGNRIRLHRASTRREFSFTARLSCDDLDSLGIPYEPGLRREEFIVVQGVVDLAVIQAESIWLVDFKTDQVVAPAVHEYAARYRPQVRMYALALSRIFRRPVTERWLHFLEPGITVAA